MDLLTVFLFFLYTWGLGYTATSLIKSKTENFWEKHLMNVGVGLGILPILILLVNLLKVPLDWRLFLVLSLVYPLFSLIKIIVKIKKKEISFQPQFKFKKSALVILIVLLLFSGTFYMYHKGAFAYSYLEDDDPWGHAVAVKYVAMEKKAYDTPAYHFSYMDPYPPGYDALLGILHQTSPSLNWTLKFFNALIISLGIFFFFFFAKEFMGNRNKALLATFFLAAIPCYLSHFIWAHALTVTLFFPAAYCFEKIKEDKKWAIPAALVVGGLIISHLVEQPLKLGIMLALYFLIKSLVQKKFLVYHLLTLGGGVILSLVWFGEAMVRYGGLSGIAKATYQVGSVQAQGFSNSSSLSGFLNALGNYFIPEGGTATRAYSFNDFFVAKSQNMINNPIGVGIILSLLVIIALIYLAIKYKSLIKEENSWLLVTLGWLAFTFLGVNSLTFHLPVGLVAFRFWMLLAIPVSLLAAEGTWVLMKFSKRVKFPAMLILMIVVIGVIFTSGYQKYSVNTAIWSPGGSWASYEEINGYAWLKDNTPINSKVYSYSGAAQLIGLDKFACVWCENFNPFNEKVLEKNMTEVHNWLKRNQYRYLVFSGRNFKHLGGKYGQENATTTLNQKINEAASMPELFKIVHQTQGFILFEVI